nr:unnamed protein product [Callosobruchus chinensis]
MVWAGISLEARTESYIIPRGSLTAVRYIDEILQDFVVPYVDLIGNNLILAHDNGVWTPYGENYSAILKRCRHCDVLEWPALSPDANPIDYVWNMLGRRIRSRVPIPLLEEWDLIPEEDIRHLFDGVGRYLMEIHD